MLLQGKAGLVTGGANGIGRTTALACAREGAAVVVSDLESSRKEGEQVVGQIAAAGGRAIFVATDVSNAAQVQRLVQTSVDEFGKLDFAFNNAGILAVGFTSEYEERDFDRIMEVNVKGVWLCMKYELLQMMKNGGGAIVNASSVAGLVGTLRAGPYVASKHAVTGLTKTAAGEYANMNIRVNAVAPGTVATRMVLDLPKEAKDMLLEPLPMHRMGLPEEVAEAVVWLSSDRASFVTGVTLPVDGGSTTTATSYNPLTSPNKL